MIWQSSDPGDRSPSFSTSSSSSCNHTMHSFVHRFPHSGGIYLPNYTKSRPEDGILNIHFCKNLRSLVTLCLSWVQITYGSSSTRFGIKIETFCHLPEKNRVGEQSVIREGGERAGANSEPMVAPVFCSPPLHNLIFMVSD
jgi:hypothetical protein